MTEKKPEKKTEKTEKKEPEVSTLRGLRRLARNGLVTWGGPKVRTRGGYKVSARIYNGVVQTLTAEGKWEDYPAEGKNVDPGWSPTRPDTLPGVQ